MVSIWIEQKNPGLSWSQWVISLVDLLLEHQLGWQGMSWALLWGLCGDSRLFLSFHQVLCTHFFSPPGFWRIILGCHACRTSALPVKPSPLGIQQKHNTTPSWIGCHIDSMVNLQLSTHILQNSSTIMCIRTLMEFVHEWWQESTYPLPKVCAPPCIRAPLSLVHTRPHVLMGKLKYLKFSPAPWLLRNCSQILEFRVRCWEIYSFCEASKAFSFPAWCLWIHCKILYHCPRIWPQDAVNV